MNTLALYAGILLPWVAGTACLVAVESRFYRDVAPNRVRQAGYGFFLGYAVLFAAVMTCNELLGAVSWRGIMAVLLLVSLAGTLITRLVGRPWWFESPESTVPVSTMMKALLSILAILTVTHLLFITVEVFTQPVFPWDAWLAWVYRAKAWFLAGSMVDIVSPTAWVTAETANTYTIDAWRYPLFASVIPYWAALSLGGWSETLINVPVLFGGLALGMAVYGQCREHGLDAVTSLLTCYLLYSIPIFGTHLALAGYADIWMAGFTGLGFIALMRGIITRGEAGIFSYQSLLGLLMILFSVWVKNEGTVWFLAAIAMWILATCKPRVPILMMVFAVLLTLLGFVLGYTHVDIPLLGKLGLVDGRLALPLIGSFNLEPRDVWSAYWDNFVGMGSWNLLWVALAGSLLLGFRSPNHVTGYRTRRTALSFILAFLATQVFIFGFTDQGLWADTYTAINRLPLHFLPALMFAVVIIANAFVPELDITKGTKASSRTLVTITVSLLAAMVVITSAIAYLSRNLPESKGQTVTHPATDLSFSFGSGFPQGERMLVDGFANGFALLSSGPVSISAESKRVLVYTWLPSRPNLEAAFFWRRSDESKDVQRTDITLPGTHLIDLGQERQWQGEIIEFGFLVGGADGDSIEVGDINLIPDSLGVRLDLTWHAWTSFEPLTQKSINFLYGGGHRQLLLLPVLVISWLLSTLLLIWLFSRFRREFNYQQFFVIASILFLTGWALLDIRWSVNNIRQLAYSFQSLYQEDTEGRPGKGPDVEIYQRAEELKNGALGNQPARILILGDAATTSYTLGKTKYDLLPHSARVAAGFPEPSTAGSLDYVLFLGLPADISKIPGWNPQWQYYLVAVDGGEWGTVFRVSQ